MQLPKIEIASVKVMRSHDYCHFEVCLSTSDATTPQQVDDLRKTAARLADKAVEQYKAAKRAVELRLGASYSVLQYSKQAEEIQAIAETERTPEQQAILKAWTDACFRDSRRYDYEDDWRQDDDENN